MGRCVRGALRSLTIRIGARGVRGGVGDIERIRTERMSRRESMRRESMMRERSRSPERGGTFKRALGRLVRWFLR